MTKSRKKKATPKRKVGLKANGKLKKGYRYVDSNRIVKAKSKK